MLLTRCSKQSSAIYRPRRPDKTALFEIIKKHYRTWLQNTKQIVPKYTQKTFEKYLECGNPAKGFACAHCFCCQADFFIPFSCKMRGLCPSCNTLTMVKTAAHLLENVIPHIPIRQWVISFPLRIRHYLLEHKILQDILEIVVDEIRQTVLACSPDVPNAQIGAISFLQNFGATLNLHPHIHLIVSDGVFFTENELQQLEFREVILTENDISTTQEHIRKRILRFFSKKGLFSREETEKMESYKNTGFSLDASVKIHSFDREGLERLIRYCARPCFASENLRINGQWIIYRLSKPTHKGQTFIQLDPMEFLDRLAAFIPFPYRHRRHYHGAFAPNAPMRKIVAAYAKNSLRTVPCSMQKAVEKTSRVSFDWAQLIKRIYEIDPLICSKCGDKIKMTRFVIHQAEIHRILTGIGCFVQFHSFDPPYELLNWEFCQLIADSEDGFPSMDQEWDKGPDPPDWDNGYDTPHPENEIDPPH